MHFDPKFAVASSPADPYFAQEPAFEELRHFAELAEHFASLVPYSELEQPGTLGAPLERFALQETELAEQ